MASVNVKKRVMDLLRGTKASTGYYGFPDLGLNTDSVAADIWTSPTYSDAERARIVAKLAAQPLTILGEFPRTATQYPVLVVSRQGDGEDLAHVGGYLETEDADNNDVYERHRWGTHLRERIQLTLQTAGSGTALRDDLYLALRELTLRGRDYLHAAGAIEVLWQDGRDSNLYRPEREPHIVHEAIATLACINELSWTEDSERLTTFDSRLQTYGGAVTASPIERT